MGIRSTISAFSKRLRAALANNKKSHCSVRSIRAPIYIQHDHHDSIYREESHRTAWLASGPHRPRLKVSIPCTPSPCSVALHMPSCSSIVSGSATSEESSCSTSNGSHYYHSQSPVSPLEFEWHPRERPPYDPIFNDDKWLPYKPDETYPPSSFSAQSMPSHSLSSITPSDTIDKAGPRHLPHCARLIVTLEAALFHVRYAISGHLALWLHDPLWDMGLPPDASRASEPSIVCPMATRDVLSSWAVATEAFYFDPKRANCLQVRIDSHLITVAIQWVEDSEFDRPGSFYEIDQTRTIYSLVSNAEDKCLVRLDMSPLVLSLKSLLQHTSLAFLQAQNGNHDNADEFKRCSLGFQVNACLQLLARQVAFDGKFLTSCEVPAMYDPRFLDLYHASFGVSGMQTMLAVIGSTPLLGTDDVMVGSPTSRPASATSTTSSFSMFSKSSSTSMHSIPRKPLPINGRHRLSDFL